MEETGAFVDPNEVDMRHLIFFSDKVQQKRQQEAQKASLKQGVQHTSAPRTR